ncbi:MAG: glycosyltransferase family 4 protein [Xanthobacteraceae bacterium]
MTSDFAGEGRGRLGYLALETPIPGQASHTHITEMIRQLEVLGWRVERFHASQTGAAAGRSFARRFLDYVGVQARLVSMLRRLDAIYVRSHPAALPAVAMARLFRCPVFQEVNGTHADLLVTYPRLRRVMGMLKWVYRYQYRHAAAVFAVTPQLAAWTRAETGHGRVHVAPCAADTSLFTPEGPRHDIGRPYVIFIGSLVGWHDLDTLVTVQEEAEWPPGVSIVVVGDGIRRGEIEAAAKNNPSLIWLRHQPHEAIPPILRGALAALVLITNPAGRSDTGVLPLKLFEAMACGVPVIVTDLPAQRELVIDEKAGIVIPAHDPKALAEAVRDLAADPERARGMGQGGAEAARARHDWRHSAGIVDAVIRNTLSGR